MPNSLSSDVVHACVVVGCNDTQYRSAGRGDAVVLLAADPATATALLERLPRRLRVLAPDMMPKGVVGPEAADRFDEWLHGFLDALGIPRTSLITDSFFAAATLGFALLDPDRVNGVVFLTSTEGRQAPDGARSEKPALLVTPCTFDDGLLVESVVEEIVEFLDGLA
jgi:pimeloyl-ACP methyl ester carboxylesterase